MSTGQVVGIGAGIAAIAAASYYFLGPEGKKNRKDMKGWMIKMKGEIVEKMEDAKEMTQNVYDQIVDSVAANYLKGGKVSIADVGTFVTSLKKQWKGISGSTSGAKKNSTASKKIAKKVSSKSGSSKASKKK